MITKNPSKYRTIIYDGVYYGSTQLWVDAHYAFRHRRELVCGMRNPNESKWEFICNEGLELARLLNCDYDDIPSWDGEFIELPE